MALHGGWPLSTLFGPLFRYYKNKGFKGIGELMPNLPFMDPLVQNYFKHAEDVGFPITFDGNGRIGGTYGLYDDPGQPQLEACPAGVVGSVWA